MVYVRLSRLCILVIMFIICKGIPMRINDFKFNLPSESNRKLKTLDSAVISEVLEAIISNIGGVKRIDMIKSVDKSSIDTRNMPKADFRIQSDRHQSGVLSSTRKHDLGGKTPMYSTISTENTSINRRKLLANGVALRSMLTPGTSSAPTVTSASLPSSTSSTSFLSTSTTNAPTTKISTTPTTSKPVIRDNKREILERRVQFCNQLKRMGRPLPRQCGGMLGIWNK